MTGDGGDRVNRRRLVLLGLAGGLWLAAAAARGGYWSAAAGSAARPIDPARIEVLDGDTFRIEGQAVRLLGVDTPEKSAPWFEGDQQPWAGRAARLARRLLARASCVVLRTRGRRDAHGRLLGHLVLDGEPLAVLLAEAGLAYPTVHRYGDGGFPRIATRISRRARPPAFEKPWEWRRSHRVER